MAEYMIVDDRRHLGSSRQVRFRVDAVRAAPGALIVAGQQDFDLVLAAGVDLAFNAAAIVLDIFVLLEWFRFADRFGNGSAPVSYDVPPQPVTLRPGEQVTARVLWRNTLTDSTAPATKGHYLEIAPAAGEPPQLVAPSGGIDLGTTGRLAVNPWAVRS